MLTGSLMTRDFLVIGLNVSSKGIEGMGEKLEVQVEEVAMGLKS